jgi:peroxiredoxin Q/BCP
MPDLTGTTAPDFSLPGSDGRTHSLKDYRGKTVVLYFYPKDDTPGCTKEACGFRDANQALQAKGVVVLGVSRDSIESHRAFAAKYGLPFVLLADETLETTKAYGAWGEKLMYGKPVTGILRSTAVIGPDGNIVKHWPRIQNAEEHPAQVLALLAP